MVLYMYKDYASTLRIRFYKYIEGSDDGYVGGTSVYTSGQSGAKNTTGYAAADYFRLVVGNANTTKPLTISYTPVSDYIGYNEKYRVVGVLPSSTLGDVLPKRVAPDLGLVKDQYFVLNDQLCKSKKIIAGGTSLALNTDYEITTISDEFDAISDELDEIRTKTVSVSGTTPTITGIANTRYNCGTVSTLTITPPNTGIIDIIFTSGTTATVLTLPNTVNMPEWFDSTSLEANRTYEINIVDGVYGAVMSWPS